MSGSGRHNGKDSGENNSAFLDLSQKTFGENREEPGLSLFGSDGSTGHADYRQDDAVYLGGYTPIRKHKSKRRYKKNRSVSLLVVLIYTIIGFTVCSLLVTRYVTIVQKDRALDKKEAEIEELELQVEQKQLEVSLKDDISMVQSEARDALGMYYPNNSQIIYIHLNRGETEADVESENEVLMNDDLPDSAESLE